MVNDKPTTPSIGGNTAAQTRNTSISVSKHIHQVTNTHTHICTYVVISTNHVNYK